MNDKLGPSGESIRSALRNRRNWGRWGPDDQQGALNLITPEKRIAAARLVRHGRVVSLSREIRPGAEFVGAPTYQLFQLPVKTGGAAVDHIGLLAHGFHITHIDALCHTWDEDGMWQGRDPSNEVTPQGVGFGGIEQWGDGIVTRGILLDVPKYRGKPYVAQDHPVHGAELADVANAQGVRIEPGDAVAVYCGRSAWQVDNPSWRGDSLDAPAPGLDASCLFFLRDNDVAVLIWDMAEASPSPYDLTWRVHAAIFAYGLALVDNALLEPLIAACAAAGTYEFMLTVAPLPIVGGTGSAVNPLAIL